MTKITIISPSEFNGMKPHALEFLLTLVHFNLVSQLNMNKLLPTAICSR